MKKLTILLISVLVIVILMGILESSSIISVINPRTTPEPTLAYPGGNAVLPEFTPTPDPYTGTVEGIKIHCDNYNDSNELTAGQKMNAIRIAINNSTIQEKFNEFEGANASLYGISNASLYIGPVILSMMDNESGYLKRPNVANVPIKLGLLPLPEYLIAYVDIKNDTIAGVDGWWSRMPGTMDTSIPPGGEWYHGLMEPWVNTSDDMSRIEMHVRLVYSPGDAELYPIIVDDSNFSLLKNGSMFSPVKFIDYVTNQTIVYADATPIVPEWTANGTSVWEPHISFGNAILPDYNGEPYPAYYVIIINADNRPVQILELDSGP